MKSSGLDDFRAYASAKRHFHALHGMLRAPSPSSDAVFMQSGAPLAVTHANAPLEVRTWGSGPLVVFVHGLLSSGEAFASIVPRVTQCGFRALVFDAPAHGSSPGVCASSDEVADALFSIRDVTGPPFAVVGHSMGATWSLYAQHLGLNATRLACIAPARLSAALEFYIRHVKLEGPVLAHLMRLLEVFTPPMARSPASIAGTLCVPGLVVHDRCDPLRAFDEARELSVAWGARTLWTDGLGHMEILHDDAVVDAVTEFMLGVDTTARDADVVSATRTGSP